MDHCFYVLGVYACFAFAFTCLGRRGMVLSAGCANLAGSTTYEVILHSVVYTWEPWTNARPAAVVEFTHHLYLRGYNGASWCMRL